MVDERNGLLTIVLTKAIILINSRRNGSHEILRHSSDRTFTHCVRMIDAIEAADRPVMQSFPEEFYVDTALFVRNISFEYLIRFRPLGIRTIEDIKGYYGRIRETLENLAIDVDCEIAQDDLEELKRYLKYMSDKLTTEPVFTKRHATAS